jgi:ABC-type glycerol-3-phosphate transport system permease component
MATTPYPVSTEGRRARRARPARSLAYHLIVGGTCLVMIYPILWLFASSLKAPDEIWTNVTSLIPRALAFNNYAEGWRGFRPPSWPMALRACASPAAASGLPACF